MCNIVHLKSVVNFLLLVITSTNCFNIEEREPIVKRGTPGTYFGYSLALHRNDSGPSTDNSWILVGAPLGQNLQPNTSRSGALFKCPIIDDGECTQVVTDGKKRAGGRYKVKIDFDYEEDNIDGTEDPLLPPQNDEIKDNQWLGVTVKSQGIGGNVMVCAHRYIQSPNLFKFQYGYGLCYLLDKNLEINEQPYQPCKGRPVDKLHQQYGFCQVGTSLAFFKDGMVAVGAPGPYTWRGTIFTNMVTGDFMRRDKTTYQGPLNDNPTPINKYSYLGMSVDGGHFFDKDRFVYVSGAPRSQMFGQVFFMEKNSKFNAEMEVIYILNGTQLGSGYGYQLLAVDLNNDGYDDLLVGAPFFYEDTQKQGRGGAVYVYTNLRNCISSRRPCEPDQTLHSKPQTRFGFSMANLGDINIDGYNDVAIGAPYERITNDSYGVVRIYLGKQNGLHTEPSQTLQAGPQVKTFGYSLSGNMDMDGNQYPDLVVGAYESDVIALYKTRKIVNIHIALKNDNELKKINATQKGCQADPHNTTNTCFSFDVCFNTSEKLGPPSSFKVVYEITEETNGLTSRIWLKNDKQPKEKENHRIATIKVKPHKTYCTSETAYIKQGVSDILQPIQFRVKYTMEKEDVGSPVLNTTATKTFFATFQKDCGDDNICQTKLKVEAKTNFTYDRASKEYIVENIANGFILNTTVLNTGEPAYNAKLFIVHPKALSYINTIKGDNAVVCAYVNATLIVCQLGNPLYPYKKINLQISFDIVKSSKDSKLEVNLFVNSTSDVELSTKNRTKLIANLHRYAKFELNCKATQTIFYGGQIKGEYGMKTFNDIGTKVSHEIHIENTGEWDMDSVNVRIFFPYQVWQEGNLPGKWLLYPESIPLLHVDDETLACSVTPPDIINQLGLTVLPNETNPRPNIELPNKKPKKFIVPSEKRKINNKEKTLVPFKCQEGSAKCAIINCFLNSFIRRQSATIEIKSRIWNSTLYEDYSNLDWVTIEAFVNVTIDSSLLIDEGTKYNATMVTTGYPDILLADVQINWWWIVLGVVAGLVLLIILSIILYKCGFFRRNRFTSKDPTLTGNIVEQDQEQKQELIKKGSKKK